MSDQNAVQEIAADLIQAGKNHRKKFAPVKLKELAASIEANGLIQPPTIRPVHVCTRCNWYDGVEHDTCPECGGDDFVNGTYRIVAGERRFRAMTTVLNWPKIPVLVKRLTNIEAYGVMLVENVERVDLNAVEESDAYWEGIEEHGCTVEQVAEKSGKSMDLIKRRLSLRELDEDVRHLLANGHLPIGHAEAMTDLDANRQRIAIRIFREAKNGMPLTAFRGVISQLLEEQSQDSLFDLESFWVEQVQQNAELPRKGKRAITGAPTRKDIPQVHIQPRDNQGVIIDRYIADLLATGHEAEAAAIGNLYEAMVHQNYMAVPVRAELLKK